MKNLVIPIVVLLLFSPLIGLTSAQGQFVGSKESDVYHYPNCSYVQNIKPENKIYFTDAQNAVNHGYHPCSICNPPLPASPTQSPSPTPSITPSPTPTVKSTPTPTPILTPSTTLPTPASPPSATPTPIATPESTSTTPANPTSPPQDTSPSPTPQVPETSTLSLLLITALASALALFSKKRTQ